MSSVFVLGGARSGKSRYAQSLALAVTARPVYVATSRVWDADHAERIARHQRERGPEWRTIECETALGSLELAGEVVVVDCVTLWLSNLFHDKAADVEACLTQARAEIERLMDRGAARLIIVSNEIGQSLHAPTEVGRKFTDLQGWVNQHIAARADDVVLMVAGIPWYVKGRERRQ